MLIQSFIPLNSFASSNMDMKEQVIIDTEQKEGNIKGFINEDSIRSGEVDYYISKGTSAYVLLNSSVPSIKIDGVIYSQIEYMFNDDPILIYVDSKTINSNESTNNINNVQSNDISQVEFEKELNFEAKESSEDVNFIDETKESDSVETNDIEQAESDSNEVNEEIKIDSVEETNDINENHEQTEAEDNKIETFSVQSKALTQEASTSKLGHIRSSNVDIYETIGGKSFKAGSKYTNAVYYIKRQAVVGSDTYYLLSKNPSATTGVVGWAKSTDLSTHDHKGVDEIAKVF